MKEGLFIVLVIVVSTALIGTVLMNPVDYAENKMNKFNSIGELTAVLKESQQTDYNNMIMDFIRAPVGGIMTTAVAESGFSQTKGSTDFSTTNIQVQGVDEADIVKTDGKYLYVLTGNKLVILDAYPAEQAEILSEIEINGTAIEIFINENKLVVFYNSNNYENEVYDRYNSYSAVALTYDITDKINPLAEKEVKLEGSYFDSRMIGDYVYMIVNQPIVFNSDYENVSMPSIEINDAVKQVEATDVYYFDEKDSNYGLTTIVSINLKENEIKTKTFLKGNSQNLFVSQENIYLVVNTHGHSRVGHMSTEQKTVIHKMSIDEGEIEFKATGKVPGQILNQFSMDEYNGFFRIATTSRGGSISIVSSQQVADSDSEFASKNNVYVLNEDMNIVGKLEGLAPGEEIYSARFLGDRCYLVTFKVIDPLFVIDLSSPEAPMVLGKLKIPGYSDYLHPYDENHIIGIGKDTIEAEQGDFAWHQGVKIALFDVSDVSNPVEKAKVIIGDRGTDSEALKDHKAFLFDLERNLLVIPITLAEIPDYEKTEEMPSRRVPYGEFTFQGAYVYHLDTEGFDFRGRITHVEDDSLINGGYHYSSSYSVRRSLYMDDVLYTISNGMVKMNNLNDLSEINKIVLPYENQYNYKYYGEERVGIAIPMTG